MGDIADWHLEQMFMPSDDGPQQEDYCYACGEEVENGKGVCEKCPPDPLGEPQAKQELDAIRPETNFEPQAEEL